MTIKSLALILALAALLPGETPKTVASSKNPELVSPSATPVTAGGGGSKLVRYTEREIVPIQSRVRFTTLIVLPKSEQILDFVVGDKEFWIVNGVNNFAFVKPAKAGAETNLNLITASGNIYSFALSANAESDRRPADLKVFVEANDPELLSAISGEPKLVPASAVKDFEAQYRMAKEGERLAHEQADLKVLEAQKDAAAERARVREEFPAALKFGYRFKKEETFAVAAIYRDEKFTYIQASPHETPAVYEVKDGKPSLVNFQYKDGLYTLDKIVTDGYLAIGKKKLPFELELAR